MWEHRFRDSVLQGAVLVGTHTDEETRAARAVEALRDSGAERVDCFDASGEPAEQPAAR